MKMGNSTGPLDCYIQICMRPLHALEMQFLSKLYMPYSMTSFLELIHRRPTELQCAKYIYFVYFVTVIQ